MQIKLTNAAFPFRKRLLMLMMKTFIFLCCTMVFSFTPTNVVSQNSKIKIDQDKTLTVDQVFELIMDQTDYNFIYEVDLFKDFPSIKVKKGIINTNKLLQYSLSFKDVDIVVTKDNTIIVKEKLDINKIQEIQVTGKVTDVSGLPLLGVTVLIKGTSSGTSTDFDGKYAITVANPENVLVFSALGFAEQEITVGDKNTINVALKEQASELGEVVVNAGYYKVKDKERTGSISRITSKDIETQPVTNFLATMQGRMAGVNITQLTGTAGGGFNIQIRGQNSVRRDGNSPLYIIDGVPYSSESIGTSMSIIPLNSTPLNNINPADIESLEVLKDADATAIYGSRGANGVVLITTKKGQKGKTKFDVSLSQGVGKVPHFMEMMNTEQYLAMRAEGFANDGITEYPENAYDINGTWDQNRYTNWQKELMGGTSEITNINASVSGGSDQTQFMISGTYAGETTVLPGDFGFSRVNVRSSLYHESINKRFKITFSGGYAVQQNDQPSTDLTIEGWRLAPNAPALYDAEGNLNWENNTFENPLALLNGLSTSKTHDLVANTTFTYSILENLDFKTNLGYTDLSHHESSTRPSTIYNPAEGLGSEVSGSIYTDTDRQSWIVEPQLNWVENFNALRTDVLIGGTFQRQNNKSLSMSANGFSSNNLIYNPIAATDLLIRDFDDSVYKYQSFFGRANFNFKEKYILNITGRRDGSSRFGDGKRFGWFGAIGTAWIFSNEALFRDNSVISFGKIRASYGTTGNDQIGNYQFLNSYSATSSNYEGVTPLQPSRLYNANFGWESNKKLEVALETGLLNNRIYFTTAWYLNRSSNQLLGVPLPGTTGFTEIQANLDAIVENRGVEFTLETVNILNDNFNWRTSFNISRSKNTLISFPNLESSTYKNRYVIGQPLNIDKLYHYTGIDPETGLHTFEDVNGDGMLTALEDQQTVKDLSPQFFGGLQNQFRFKNWQLDFLFQFVKQQNFNIPRTLGISGMMFNQSTEVLEHWQEPGDTGPTQLYTSGANGAAVNAMGKYGWSDAAITDTSFIRLKNIALSYQFPERWIKNVKCKAILEAQNLLTFTPYKGADPEAPYVGWLPSLKIVTVGLKFNF